VSELFVELSEIFGQWAEEVEEEEEEEEEEDV
jgi:hypothetical protein